jgi:hypothetical protein
MRAVAPEERKKERSIICNHGQAAQTKAEQNVGVIMLTASSLLIYTVRVVNVAC